MRLLPSPTVSAVVTQQQKFIAKLTGKDQVPPIDTKATGNFEMELGTDGIISRDHLHY